MSISVMAYISEWGDFTVPDDLSIVETHEVRYARCDGEPDDVGIEPLPLPHNRLFWQWLHVQEIAAGKPEVAGISNLAWRRLGEEEKKNLH